MANVCEALLRTLPEGLASPRGHRPNVSSLVLSQQAHVAHLHAVCHVCDSMIVYLTYRCK